MQRRFTHYILPGRCAQIPWWRHQMETFTALLAICAGNSPGTGEFPSQRPLTRTFDVFVDLGPNKRLSKDWWGCWFETPSRPLWCQCNVSIRAAALALWDPFSHDIWDSPTSHSFKRRLKFYLSENQRNPCWTFKRKTISLSMKHDHS